MKVATYTVRASQAQAISWNRAAAGEGYASTGAWIAAAVDAYLRVRARAGAPLPLCWSEGRFRVLLVDGREIEVSGRVSPPFGTYQGNEAGRNHNKPRTLVHLPSRRIIATLRTARQCRYLASELAPVLIRGDPFTPAEGIIDRHRRETV